MSDTGECQRTNVLSQHCQCSCRLPVLISQACLDRALAAAVKHPIGSFARTCNAASMAATSTITTPSSVFS